MIRCCEAFGARTEPPGRSPPRWPIASAYGKMVFQTRLANRSLLACEPVSVRNNASGDGKGILAAETGYRFGGQEAFQRPVVRRTCNPQPLSYGNHGLLGRGCKNAETARVVGGARRNRTDDLFNAIEALSQLSYGPVFQIFCA